MQAPASWVAAAPPCRLVGRAAATECNSQFREHSGDDQFGLQPDGAGKLRRLMQADAATRPGVVLWAADMSDAVCHHQPRRGNRRVRGRLPDPGAAARAWLATSSTHTIAADGDAALADQHVGLGQGCP